MKVSSMGKNILCEVCLVKADYVFQSAFWDLKLTGYCKKHLIDRLIKEEVLDE